MTASHNAPACDAAQRVPDFPPAALLAHELRTPLSAIAAAIEIFRDERWGPLGDARYASYAADIHATALHALAVVDRLTASSLEPLAETPVAAPVAVDVLVRDLVSGFAALAGHYGVALELAAPEPAAIATDATLLRQILINLLSNALKFTARGGRVVARVTAKADGALVIAIEDSGGAALEHADPEANAAPGPTPTPSGSGIGLPMASFLARRLNGSLSHRANAAGGMTAVLAFPGSVA